MKMLTAILMLVFAISSFASRDTQTFVYDGSQDSVELNLSTEKTHTEYRWEQRPSICYRQVVHYRTVCQSTPHGRQCHTYPVYTTVPYSCMETVQIPYEVKDFDVEATVTINVAKLPEFASRESLVATMNGDELKLTAKGSGKYIIVQNKGVLRSQMTGAVKYIQASYDVELVEAAPVVKALELTNISLYNSILNFKMGPVAVRDLIGFSLNVAKNPVIGGSTVLFDRELATSELTLQSDESVASVNVNIDSLGIKMGKGRHTLTAKAFFKHSGKVINADQFERLEAGRTLIYKVR